MDVKDVINVGQVSYDVDMEPIKGGYKITRVNLITPTIRLYFDVGQQVLSLTVISKVEYEVRITGGIKEIIVNAKIADEIKAFGLGKLWDQLSKLSPFSYAVNDLIAKLLNSWETVLKATLEVMGKAKTDEVEHS
jgi:hypothetical protein